MRPFSKNLKINKTVQLVLAVLKSLFYMDNNVGLGMDSISQLCVSVAGWSEKSPVLLCRVDERIIVFTSEGYFEDYFVST